MSQSALDLFGELLMTKVRDEAILVWKMIVDGSMKGVTSERVNKMLSLYPDGYKNIIKSLVPDIVDTVLHHLLWTLDQNDNIHIRVTIDNQEIPSLKDISGDLPGELYADDGWIARFSKEKADPSET